MSDLIISEERQRTQAQEQAGFTPDPEVQKKIKDITGKYDTAKRARWGNERAWFLNACFIAGHQHVSWNDVEQRFQLPVRMGPYRVRYTANRILPYYRRTKAKLTANKPGLFVRPATTDEVDVSRARTQEKVISSEFDRMGFFARFKEAVGWAIETGGVYYRLVWNPRAGQPLTQQVPVVDPATGLPAFDPETGEEALETVPLTDEDGNQLFSGENELEVCSQYEIVKDPQATCHDDAEWMIRAKVRPLSRIRTDYKNGHLVKAGKDTVGDYFEERLKNVIGQAAREGTKGSSSENEAGEESAVVFEYWERPTREHPTGRYVTCAGDVILEEGENPYGHKLSPYIYVAEIELPGRATGVSATEQLIPIQKNFNRGRSQEIENRTLVGRPKILVPKTAKMRQDSFDSEPGEKIEYMPGPRGERPELLMPPSTSAATQAEIAQTVDDFQESASYHEASKGVMPSANAPAAAIERLQMADETSLGDVASNFDIAHVKLAKMLLSNCAQFWDEERMVRAAGEGSRLEAMRVRGDDLSGEDVTLDYFDVQAMPRSTLWKDPAQVRKDVQFFVEMGLLNPQLHRDRIIKMLDRADLDEVYVDDRLDEDWAARENELMEAGQPSMPKDFENHEIHLRVLNRFRKSERYRRLPPQNQQIFDQHALMHEQHVVVNAQKLAMTQAAVQMAGMGGMPGEETGEEVPSQPAEG